MPDTLDEKTDHGARPGYRGPRRPSAAEIAAGSEKLLALDPPTVRAWYARMRRAFDYDAEHACRTLNDLRAGSGLDRILFSTFVELVAVEELEPR